MLKENVKKAGAVLMMLLLVGFGVMSYVTFDSTPKKLPTPKPQPKTDFWGNQMPADGTVSVPSVPSGSVPSGSLTKLEPAEFVIAVRDLKVGQVLPERIRVSCLLYQADGDGTTYYYPTIVEDGTMNIRVDTDNKVKWINLAKPNDKE